MIINSRHFDQIEIEENKIITFKKGIYGFEHLRQFMLLEKGDDENNPFKLLHCVDDPEICFVVIDPINVLSDYSFKLNDYMKKAIKIKNPENVLIFSIVVIPDIIKEMTTNLKSPIIIDVESKYGIQVILDDERYQIKHKILKQVREGSEYVSTNEKNRRVNCSR